MYTEGFIIRSDGDPTVGIYPAEWQLTGGFYFSDQEELEEFRTKLKEAFEYAADDAYVETFEEVKEIEDRRTKGMGNYDQKS